MRMSLGQKTHEPEHGHGLVMTVMVATPEAERLGLMRSAATSRSSSSGVMPQLAQRSGSSRLTRW